MDSKEFKKIFDSLAKTNGFEVDFGGCFRESEESIVVLNLQKSNFGNYYELNIKIFVQGVFNVFYKKNKDLVKKEIGTIFRRQPEKYNSIFDLDFLMSDAEREDKLKTLFLEFITPFSEKALFKAEIMELAKNEEIKLLPAVKNAMS